VLKVVEIMRALERAWEAGSLPGKQCCEFNAALRALQQLLEQQSATHAPAHLRLVC
jgi:hypothetical protein